MCCIFIIATQGRELKALTISSNIANVIPPWETSKSERVLTYIDQFFLKSNWHSVKFGPSQDKWLKRQRMITCHFIQQISVAWFAHGLSFLGEQDYTVPLPEILDPPELQTNIQRAWSASEDAERQNSGLPRDAIG